LPGETDEKSEIAKAFKENVTWTKIKKAKVPIEDGVKQQP
jgi:hypothetical protein